MAKFSRDGATPAGGLATLHPREALFVAGNLGSLNAEVVIAADGCSTVALDLRGTFNLTAEVSGSIDGVNWTPIPMRPVNAASKSYVAAIAGSAAGVWVGKCAPFRIVRARATAYTSGLAAAGLHAGNGALDDSLEAMLTSSMVTATGASGAAVTLTLPAPGAGLRQYLTYLAIGRYAAAVLTASATPVIVTTTNLPGSLAFTVPADAAALGTFDRYREDFSFPLAASAQNTAVTFVCPATTGVIWRATGGYYIAP